MGVMTLDACVQCGIPLQEAIAGYRKTSKGVHCSDCFFDEFSDLVDQHPIGKPMSTRGHAA
jgi:hypothetical protein